MKFWISILFLFSISIAEAVDLKDVLPFEEAILQEAKIYDTKNPLKTYELRLLMAREYYAYGLNDKAVEHYEAALSYPVKVDRSEALVNSILLTLDHKVQAFKKLERLKKSPEGKKKELQEWITVLESNLSGKTQVPLNHSSPLFTWATDQKIDELISQKKFAEAFLLLGPEKLDSLNINFKIRSDLLTSAVLKKVPPKLWCEETLKRYPSSITWTMRVCRYLKEKRDAAKLSETIQSIKVQTKEESPQHLIWIDALGSL